MIQLDQKTTKSSNTASKRQIKVLKSDENTTSTCGGSALSKSTAPYSNASSKYSSSNKQSNDSSCKYTNNMSVGSSTMSSEFKGGFSDATACFLKTKSSKFKKFQLSLAKD